MYRQVIADDSLYPEAPYVLGLVYVSMDSLDQAKYWLTRTLAIDPEHQDAAAALQAIEARSRR
jgi:Tfp pilus assembly protein PilF